VFGNTITFFYSSNFLQQIVIDIKPKHNNLVVSVFPLKGSFIGFLYRVIYISFLTYPYKEKRKRYISEF